MSVSIVFIGNFLSSSDFSDEPQDDDQGCDDDDFIVKNGEPCGLDMDGSHISSNMEEKQTTEMPTGPVEIKRKTLARYRKRGYTPAVEATIQLALAEVRNPFVSGLGDALVNKLGHFKRKDKVSYLLYNS